MHDRFGGGSALGNPHIGKRLERALDVVARRQQRLRHVDTRAGHDADGTPPPPFVEQLHGACGTFAGNLDARDVIADLDRQFDASIGFAIAGLEREGASPSGRPLRSSARTVPVSDPPGLRAAP